MIAEQNSVITKMKNNLIKCGLHLFRNYICYLYKQKIYFKMAMELERFTSILNCFKTFLTSCKHVMNIIRRLGFGSG